MQFDAHDMDNFTVKFCVTGNRLSLWQGANALLLQHNDCLFSYRNMAQDVNSKIIHFSDSTPTPFEAFAKKKNFTSRLFSCQRTQKLVFSGQIINSQTLHNCHKSQNANGTQLTEPHYNFGNSENFLGLAFANYFWRWQMTLSHRESGESERSTTVNIKA